MIQLIGATIIDWGNYVKLVEKYITVSPTKILDEANIPSGSSEGFIYSLKSIDGEFRLKHLHYTFACTLNNTILMELLLLELDIEITVHKEDYADERFFILSGDIGTLKELITSCTKLSVRKSFRVFLNQMFLIFEGLGFKEIFSDYRKIPFNDNTFILERRNG